MKKLLAVAVLVLITAVGNKAQTSNSLPFTAVIPPPPPALSSLGGLSPTGKIYTGAVMAVNGTGFAAGCVVNVDGTAQPASTFVFSSASLINFTIPASLGSASGVAHTLTVSCAAPVLALNSPVALPNFRTGIAYTANLSQLAQVRGGVAPYKFTLSSGSLPTGFSLSQSGVVAGTTSLTGSFSFSYTVADSSGLAWEFKVDNGKLVAERVPAHVTKLGS